MKPSLFFQLRSLLILINLLVSILVSAREFHDVKLGKTQFTQKLSKNLVVEVGLHQMLVDSNCSYKSALLWGGDVGESPKAVVASLSVKVNTEEFFIPFSAYGDLGDIKSAELEKIAGGFNLILNGGDTATSYDAVLTFKQGYLYSKKVTLWEFPTQRWEKIIYSFTKN